MIDSNSPAPSSPMPATVCLRAASPAARSAWAPLAQSLLAQFGISVADSLNHIERLPSIGAATGATTTVVEWLSARCPIDGRLLAWVPTTDIAHLDALTQQAQTAQERWRDVPPPQRGARVRELGEALRQHRAALAQLITLETGKIPSEAMGEVQEAIDICEFAVGLSRQLYGLTLASERPAHALRETWHPLGCVALITAFNFPVAVWAWNAALALVCGNAVLWKPSEKTSLSALAVHALCQKVLTDADPAWKDLCTLCIGAAQLGEALVNDARIALVSATGSTRMGRAVASACAPRFKRTLLELGGNNGAVVCESADIDLALRACVFAAFGTAGQRCTSLRRLFIARSRYEDFSKRLRACLPSLPIGNPFEAGVLIGPLIDSAAEQARLAALDEARALGARVMGGERLRLPTTPVDLSSGVYAAPAIVETDAVIAPMRRETFAPVLYLMPFDTLDAAIALNNDSDHGLSSAIFTRDLREAEHFLSAHGAHSGLVNVNLGTSGAEIGGAFGGEKDTGGGRESGSDAWKQYMRRATNTINYGNDLPLAQGVRFDFG